MTRFQCFQQHSATLTAGAADPSTVTYGTMYAINPEFFKLIYESDSDFNMLKDDSGKTIFKRLM